MITLYPIDDDDQYLDCLEGYFKLAKEFKIIGTYNDVREEEGVEEMLENIEFYKPDVVLMDISFSIKGRSEYFGIELTKRIIQQMPEQKIIMLAEDPEDDKEYYERIKGSFRAGAKAYLSKSDMESWSEGIKETIKDQPYISKSVSNTIVGRFKSDNDINLSQREVEAIHYLSMDNRIKAVAKSMEIGFDGANFHIRNARIKLNVKTNHGLVAKAFRKGVID